MFALEWDAGADKAARYRALLPQLFALIDDEPKLAAASLANVCAALKEAFPWLWVGFYLADDAAQELLLHAFQGPVACVRIAKGRGVCGQVWASGETLVVDDVDAHPDHIACSSLSQSEIVVPVRDARGNIVAVLDADAAEKACFDADDAHYLGLLCAEIGARLDFSGLLPR